MTSYEFVWGCHLFCHAVSPQSGDDAFRRCSGERPSPRARGYGKVDNHPQRYSLILSSTQVLRELVRNQSPLHQKPAAVRNAPQQPSGALNSPHFQTLGS